MGAGTRFLSYEEDISHHRFHIVGDIAITVGVISDTSGRIVYSSRARPSCQ